MLVAEHHTREGRQRDWCLHAARGGLRLHVFDCHRHDGLGRIADLVEHIPGLQCLAVLVEHREVLPLVALAVRDARPAHGVPVRLPIEQAEAAPVRHLRQPLHDGAQARGLPLHAGLEAADALLLAAVAVRRAVEVLIRIAKGRLGDDHILAVALAHIVDIFLHGIERAVPERIVAEADDIVVIRRMRFQHVKETAEQRVVAAIRQVNHDLDLLVRIAHGPFARGDEAAEFLSAILRGQLPRRPKHAVLDLVADLHHLGLLARLLEHLQRVARVVIDILLQPRRAVASPGRRRCLMRRVRPPVAVMEVDEHLEPQRMRALRQRQRPFRVDVAAALRRVVPHAEPHPVHAVVLHDLHLIELRAIHIVELRARGLHLRQHGHIRALDEIRPHPRHRIHLHGRLRERLPRRQRSRDQRREHHTFQQIPFHKRFTS